MANFIASNCDFKLWFYWVDIEKCNMSLKVIAY